MLTIHEMKARLKASLADYRYDHAESTAETARALALRFGADLDQAYIAGLLHDCARGMDDDPKRTLALAARYGLSATDVQRSDPALFLHAYNSAHMARSDYGVTDEAILRAIELHMWGGIPMTKLDRIIFMADTAEPLRKRAEAERYRELLRENLDGAFFEAFKDRMRFSLDRDLTMSDDMSRVYNALALSRINAAADSSRE